MLLRVVMSVFVLLLCRPLAEAGFSPAMCGQYWGYLMFDDVFVVRVGRWVWWGVVLHSFFVIVFIFVAIVCKWVAVFETCDFTLLFKRCALYGLSVADDSGLVSMPINSGF